MAADQVVDPKAALAKYTYPDHEKDDAAITKVETAIATHFPMSYTAGLAASAADAPIKQSEVDDQKKEYDEKIASAKKDHPDECAKEAKEGPPPTLNQGAAVKPTVKEHAVKAGESKTPAKGKGEGAKAGGEGKKPGSGKGVEGVPKAPTELQLVGVGMGEAEFDKWLNGYPQKSPETTEKLSKIKEMSTIAKGFDGQVEGYVKNGEGGMESAKGVLVGVLGKKELGAAFGDNPYEKVHGGLGRIMEGISRFQNVISIVGNVAGKVGMVLTIVGLLAMIFPPIGAAIEAIARIINIIGIICDAIGMVLSGVLVGLNGVVLAQQIAKGGSNEEKAATADMMMMEANATGGHILNLAMAYGPGFMKGLKGASKGVIGQLFAKFKTAVGKFATKALGPVANWAKKGMYAMGKGLEKEGAAAAPGLMKRAATAVWKAPGTALQGLRNTKAVRWVNNSGLAKAAERFGGKLDNAKWANAVEGLGERAGTAVGNYGKGTARALKYEQDAARNLAETIERQESNAAKNAANREEAKIERQIDSKQAEAGKTYDSAVGADGKVNDSLAAKAEKSVDEADALRAGKGASVSKAEQDAVTETRAAKTAADAKSAEKAQKVVDEEKEIAEFKQDPKKYQDKTKQLEDTMTAERIDLKRKIKDPTTPADEVKVLKAEDAKLAHEMDERRLVSLKASGGESAEHLWHAKGVVTETIGGISSVVNVKTQKTESQEAQEPRDKWVEKDIGHEANEKKERAEQSESIHKWVEQQAPAPQAAAQVDGLLEGFEEELEEKHDDVDHEDNGEPQDAKDDQPNGDAPNGDEPPQSAQPTNDQANGPDAKDGAPPVVVAPTAAPGPSSGAAPDDGGALPELVYWPSLAGDDGDFKKAAKDLMRMKQYAFAFHKAQIEAKKKAMESYQTFLSSEEINKARAEASFAQAAKTQLSVNEATGSGAAAQSGSAKADEGSAKQNEGKGNADGKAQPAPDPGPKPGWTHPFKRCYWYIKKWVSDKAAKVFGWIQEKIASLVLQGICGVSMGDLKAYTAALHNRMAYSKGVGTEGLATGAKAGAGNEKASTDSKTYAQQALDDAADCDKNIHDSTDFVTSVESTEQDVAAEQARATQFITELRASVTAEREKLKAEKAKKAAEAAKTAEPAGPTGPTGPTAAPTATPTPTKTPAPKKKPTDAQKKKGVSAAAAAKLHTAAQYVVNQASVLVSQVTTARDSQRSDLARAFEKGSKKQRTAAKSSKAGDEIVNEAKTQAEQMKTMMDGIKSWEPTSAGAARGAAKEVKREAHALDDALVGNADALNKAFKSTYDKIAAIK